MTLTGKFFTAMMMCCSLFAAAVASAAHHEGAMAKPEPTVVEIAAGNPDFSTLVAAVQAADLVDALSAEGPFTVFAPTNEAFAALPEGTVDMLLLPENKDKLVAILTYHVVPGKVMAAEVVEMTEATTLEGDTIAIAVTDEGVTVDGANVIATDIVGSNGVIHVIDAVIMPGS